MKTNFSQEIPAAVELCILNELSGQWLEGRLYDFDLKAVIAIGDCEYLAIFDCNPKAEHKTLSPLRRVAQVEFVGGAVRFKNTIIAGQNGFNI